MYYNSTTQEYGLFIPNGAIGWVPVPDGWVKPVPEPVDHGGSGAPRILRKDPLWSTAFFPYFGGLRWTSEYIYNGSSWIDANGLTGSLDYGYFTAGAAIHLAVCGGGATRGTQKIITVRDKTGNILISKTLNEIANRDSGEPHPATIETPGIAGQKVFIRFDDQDSNSAGLSWLGVNLSTVVISD